MTSFKKLCRHLVWALVLLAPASGFSRPLKDSPNSPSNWTFTLDPGFGLKTGVFLIPNYINGVAYGSNVQPVSGPTASLRLIVYNGTGSVFTSIDTQTSILLNTPQTAGLLLAGGFSVGYRFVDTGVRLWGGLSYDGFTNIGIGGGTVRLGASKKVHDGLDVELEISSFYAMQNVKTGTVNYELPAVDVILTFPMNL